MKTLNRPMFRYGGPIKEGVMNGIREPKRNGGSMANNEGPRRAALVGNPIYPNVDGRTNHVVPAILGAASLAGRFIAPAFGRYVMRQAPKLAKDGSKMFYKTGKKKGEQIFSSLKSKTNPAVEGFNPNAVGRFFANDPLASKAASGAGFVGGTLKKVGGGIKYATTTPSGLLFLGAPVTYSAGKYFLNSGEEIKGDDLNKITQGGKKPGENSDMYQEKQPPTAAEIEAAEAEARMKKMDKYKEIMDIKGMNKDAAYKSLIDASKIIQEGGNLKKSLKDGSLISKVTAAASKRFDKVSDTETALRSLVAKGEIENVLNKDKNALDKEYKEGMVAINKKKLAGSTLGEELSAYRTKLGKNASGKTLAGFVMDEGGSIVSIADSSAVDKHIKSGGDSVSFMELVVANNVKEGKEIIPGMYVVKDSLITVNPDGSVTPNYKIT